MYPRKTCATIEVHHFRFEVFLNLGALDLSQKLNWRETKPLRDINSHGL